MPFVKLFHLMMSVAILAQGHPREQPSDARGALRPDSTALSEVQFGACIRLSTYNVFDCLFTMYSTLFQGIYVHLKIFKVI